MAGLSAGAALSRAARAALETLDISGGVHEAMPERAAFPHAAVEAGPETDWGHKTGDGREARIAVTIADKGPTAERLHALMAAAEAAVLEIGDVPGWSLVTLRFVRNRVARGRDGTWTGLLEFRARMLADD